MLRDVSSDTAAVNANAPTTSTPAVLSLVFGIASWVALPFLGALVAVVCGHLARGEIRRAAPGTVQGDGMAVAGLILGYVHLAIFLLFGIGLLLLLAGIVSYHH